MAGTVTITYQEHTSVRVCTWTWTSDASGDASGTDSKSITGAALRWVTDPDGSAAPTTLYDIVVNDEHGVDVAGGGLANRSATAGEESIPDPPVAFSGKLSLVVANAGNAKAGVLKLYYR